MRIKEKNNFLNFLKMIFIDVDCPDDEREDIAQSTSPRMAELKESLNRVEDLEKKFYISSTSTPKGGKGNSNVVEKVNIDNNKAIRQVDGDGNGRVEQQEKSQQVER